MSGEFPVIKSTHSLVAKHVTKEKWDKLGPITTKTSGFTLAKAIACAVEFDNQARAKQRLNLNLFFRLWPTGRDK